MIPLYQQMPFFHTICTVGDRISQWFSFISIFPVRVPTAHFMSPFHSLLEEPKKMMTISLSSSWAIRPFGSKANVKGTKIQLQILSFFLLLY